MVSSGPGTGPLLVSLVLTIAVISGLEHLFVMAYDSYVNDFVDPDLILAGKYSSQTQPAQRTLVAWADELNAQGPWTVTNKPVPAPSGDKHDYMSWAPYWWPDCSKAGNTSALSPEDVWKTCPYVNRDGQANPDIDLITDKLSFQNLSDAMLYNAIVWASQKDQRSTVYSQSAVNFLKTWFLDPNTKMNPNLDYAQIIRGPQAWQGSKFGILDLHFFPKIASAILLFRKGNAVDWTSDVDSGMVSWAKEYLSWLEASDLGIGASQVSNNHATFYWNQLAALKLIVGDNTGAKRAAEMYFNRQYQTQIGADGKQPLELARTRPYHYTAFNIAAMITNARLATYTGNSTVWELPARSGATIKTAVDYAISLNPANTHETSEMEGLVTSIGAVAEVYGDPNGSYTNTLDKFQSNWRTRGWVVWTQPLKSSLSTTGGGTSTTGANKTSATGASSSTSNSEKTMGVNVLLAMTGLLLGCFLQ